MIPKDHTAFKKTLDWPGPSANWSLALQAPWYAAKGDWESSHSIAQDLHTKMGSLIHAHLHRVEGDDWNAGYWYRQASNFP